MRNLLRVRVALTVLLSALAAVPGSSQCAGLHAALQAQHVTSNNEPHVQLGFLLLNDSETPLDVHAGSWKLIINGEALEESNMLFGNGPMPKDGYTILQPGENYEFGRTLAVSRFFPTPGDYKVAWTADGFVSPTITIAIPAPNSSGIK